MNTANLFADMKQIRKERTQVPHTPELLDFTCDDCILIKQNSAINGVFRDYVFQPNSPCVTMQQVMDQCSSGIYAALKLCVNKKVFIKAYTTIEVTFQKINIMDGTVNDEIDAFLSTVATPIAMTKDIDNLIEDSIAKLNEEIENYTNKGSNWIVKEIKTLIVKLVATK